MRSLLFIGVLLFGAQATAQNIYPVLVEGEDLQNIGQVTTFSVAGLNERDELLFNGTTADGRSFAAIFNPNDEVIWAIQAGDLWADGSEIAAISAHKMLFNSSFLVTVDLIGTNARRVFARINADRSITNALDCSTSALPDCENLQISHDATGVFLAELPDRAWRITGQGIEPVFDFVVGDELPLQQGPLQAGSSCQNDGPITGWTLDAKGGVAAVVYREFAGRIRPVVMRQSLDGSFEVISPVDETWREGAKDRCATRLMGVDLSGAAYSDYMVDYDDEIRWKLQAPDRPSRQLDAFGQAQGTASAWFIQGDYQIASMSGAMPLLGLGGTATADVSRSGFLLGYTDFQDHRTLSTPSHSSMYGIPILTETDPISVRNEVWTLGNIEFGVKTAENWLGSVNSRESAAFTLTDGLTGRKALMRLDSGNDFAVSSAGDEESLPTATCESVQKIWDGRAACTLRRALELAAERPKTTITGSTFVVANRALPVITNSTTIRKVGIKEIIGPADAPVFSVDGAEIGLEFVGSDHRGPLINANNGATISMFGVHSSSYDVLLTSVDSGAVNIEMTRGGDIDVQGDSTLNPLVLLTDVHFRTFSTNGNARLVHSYGALEGYIEDDCIKMEGGPDTTLFVDDIRLGDCRVGIRAERANVHVEGDLAFYGSRGMIIGSGFTQDESTGIFISASGFGCDLDDPTCDAFGIKFLRGPAAKLSHATFSNAGPSIITQRELEVVDTEFSDVRGPAIFADLLDNQTLRISGNTSLKKVMGPAFQVEGGNLELAGKFIFEDVSSVADVAGNLSIVAEMELRDFVGDSCASFDWANQTLTPQICPRALIRSRATTGLNVISGIRASNNNHLLIEVNSGTNFEDILIENSVGGIVANAAGVIGFGQKIVIQDNVGDGIYSEFGNLEFNKSSSIRRNTGAGVVALDGDVMFQNGSLISDNGTEVCASNPECISAGIYAPKGRVAGAGIEVLDNQGDGIVAQSIALSDSTVCNNSGEQLVSEDKMLDGVDTCELRIIEERSVEGGCTSTNATSAWWLMLIALFWRRRR